MLLDSLETWTSLRKLRPSRVSQVGYGPGVMYETEAE